MKPYVQTKYTLYITPKEGKRYNPNHEQWHGKEAGIIDLPIGERGWLFYKSEFDDEYFYNIPWHRIHLSPIESVEEDENGNIHITTQNTYYTLIKVNLIE